MKPLMMGTLMISLILSLMLVYQSNVAGTSEEAEAEDRWLFLSRDDGVESYSLSRVMYPDKEVWWGLVGPKTSLFSFVATPKMMDWEIAMGFSVNRMGLELVEPFAVQYEIIGPTGELVHENVVWGEVRYPNIKILIDSQEFGTLLSQFRDCGECRMQLEVVNGNGDRAKYYMNLGPDGTRVQEFINFTVERDGKAGA